MVSIGSKALLSRRRINPNLLDSSSMGKDDKPYKHSGREKGNLHRKFKKETFTGSHSHANSSYSQPSIIRKQIDPETTKYFSELANLFESKEVDLEERSFICGNALEEARGKEYELATDYIMSHTIELLLDGCNVDHLCGFLRSCATVFPLIAMDRSGSHVAETALKSLASHLQDNEACPAIEEVLTMICKVVVDSPVIMCDRYGSHVLRSLLCLCGGVPLDAPEFHGAKPSSVLKERLNLSGSHIDEINAPSHQKGFPGLLKFIISGILNCICEDMQTFLVDQFSSLVLQTALKLSAGDDQRLMQMIPILLGCKLENLADGNFLDMIDVSGILELVQETGYSHLMEVILGVAPESLYGEMLNKLFKHSLFHLSSHHCGNFVVQALVSYAKNQEQMEFIWEELGSKFKDLLEMGRPGVVASIIATSQRLNSYERKCCQALAGAVCSANEDDRLIVPRIMFLENYFNKGDKINWSWPTGRKMHVMGSLILQAVFKFPNHFINAYITSLTSMEADHVLEASKDASGARVIETFLDSAAPAKQKRRLITKLRGKFGELALHPSGSFTIEKCFGTSNLSLREAMASELLVVQPELSKAKHGSYLLRRLDIDGFAKRPDQWRSRQASKESTYKEFYATFGSSEPKSSRKGAFLADEMYNEKSKRKVLKRMQEEIDHDLLPSNKHGKHGTGNDMKQRESKKPFLSDDMKQKRRKRGGKSDTWNKKMKV